MAEKDKEDRSSKFVWEEGDIVILEMPEAEAEEEDEEDEEDEEGVEKSKSYRLRFRKNGD